MPGSDKIIWRTTGFKGGLAVGMYQIVWICYTNMVAIPLLYLLYESRFGEYAISYVVFSIGMFFLKAVLGILGEGILGRLINKIFFFIFRISPLSGKTVVIMVIATNAVVGVIWFVVLVEHYGLFERFGLWTPGISDYLPETVKEWMVNTHEFFYPIEKYLIEPSRLMESYKYSFPPPSP